MRSEKNTHSSVQKCPIFKTGKNRREIKRIQFRKSNPGGNILFFVDVTDDRSDRIIFQMQKDNDSWKIQPQLLPDWIVKNENKLHELIEDELKFSILAV
jgi:hypothetical protein